MLRFFHKNYSGRKNDLLLAYLIFPVTLSQKCIDELKIIRRNSNLSRLIANKDCMAGFHDKFDFFKQITNQCIQYALDCKYIEITKDLSVKVINQDILFADPSLNDSVNLASKLPLLFKWDVINVYYAFGIKGL